MTIDYSKDGKVELNIIDYIDPLIEEAPSDMAGMATMPTTYFRSTKQIWCC